MLQGQLVRVGMNNLTQFCAPEVQIKLKDKSKIDYMIHVRKSLYFYVFLARLSYRASSPSPFEIRFKLYTVFPHEHICNIMWFPPVVL